MNNALNTESNTDLKALARKVLDRSKPVEQELNTALNTAAEFVQSGDVQIEQVERADTWDAEDWQRHYDERAAVFEYNGEQSRVDAEARAWKCCIVAYLNKHPVESAPGACCWCGESENAHKVVVPFGAGQSHAWLHHGCWTPWNEKRREEAKAALSKLIRKPGPAA